MFADDQYELVCLLLSFIIKYFYVRLNRLNLSDISYSHGNIHHGSHELFDSLII